MEQELQTKLTSRLGAYTDRTTAVARVQAVINARILSRGGEVCQEEE